MRKPAIAIIALLFGTTVAYPQAFTANLTGLVTDPNQAAVASANVKLVNTSTGETRQASTSVEGRYVFSQLLPGTYSLTVETAGFKTVTNSDITLRANQAGEVNVPPPEGGGFGNGLQALFRPKAGRMIPAPSGLQEVDGLNRLL